MVFSARVRVTSSNYGKVKRRMRGRAAQFVAKAALDIEAHAKALAPVDTGLLRNSIQAIQVSQLHWRVVVSAEYGVYVEFGTRHMAAQPFLLPAVNAVRPSFLAAMRTVVR